MVNAYKNVLFAPTEEHLGYTYVGRFVGHPHFSGQQGHTSLVIYEEGDEVETLNSRYTIKLKEEDDIPEHMVW